MRKITTFVSAILTAFILAVLAGVVYAYQDFASRARAKPVPDLQAVSLPPVPSPAASVPAMLYPQEAANLAAQYLKRTDLYSVEMSTFNGVQAYLVTFTSGDMVYVSTSGLILSAIPPQVQPQATTGVVIASRKKGGGGENNESDDDH